MRIGIIGTGQVGRTLGVRFAQAGHPITYASREPQAARTQAVLAGHPGQATVGPVAAVAAGAEVLLLCVPGLAASETVSPLAGFSGILIDVTNPILPGLAGLSPAGTSSGAEQVASRLPRARVVKAFNTIGWPIMANPQLAAGKAFLPVCGDDAAAKQTVLTLAGSIGFDAQDAGPLTNARYTEPFAMLWITLAFQGGKGTQFGFVCSGRAP